ncbi:diguanylate cyclase [Neiella marina]|uniref:Diguanylate cyclase n=1 Tax=Neiella holothuriorum TaxID=2870530 RepID=A0ABS7EDU8_9GAMM|nr:diguanylate cyclase [Neiella holothuriorum]MBW8189862.1 diguanylate cyclase [Neiella holothuriorum]
MNTSIMAALGALLLSLSANASLAVRYYQPLNPKDHYPIDLVEFLLQKAAVDYQLFPIQASDSTEMRQIADLNAGHISFATLATNKRLNQALHPIQYPIFRGLLGYRVFIIRKGEQARFDQVSSLQQLSQFVAGQGRFWADTQVLKSAGLPLETPVKYEGLFHMLDGGRFDYFPRAIHEPISELSARPQLNLAIENNILLIYPQPMMFYTSKANKALSQAIEHGFEAAIQDGSFAQWFVDHPMIQEVLSKIDLEQRTVIRIDNPHLPAGTPVQRSELWLDIAQLRNQPS